MSDFKYTPQQRAWLDALRSGEYAQTRRYLHDENGFCCLGVACDLAVKAGVPVEVEKDRSSVFDEQRVEITRYGGVSSMPPVSVQSWMGLLRFTSEKCIDHLADLNDTGSTFAEIAAEVEANPEQYLAPAEEVA